MESSLKKTENGVVLVTTTTQAVEAPLSSEELRRQIKQHVGVISDLEKQLNAVELFEKGELETSDTTSEAVVTSLINEVEYAKITEKDVEAVQEVEAVTPEPVAELPVETIETIK